MIRRILRKLFRYSQEDIEMVKIIEDAVHSGLRIENTGSGGFLISRTENKAIHRSELCYTKPMLTKKRKENV